MTNDYGIKPTLIQRFLRVPDMIALQDCLTGEHHDERFSFSHQAYSYGSSKSARA